MVTRDDIRRGVRYSALQETVQPFRRRFALAFVYYTSVVVAGAAGYSLIEGWSFFESLYMSAITVSSVGFAEIHPLSDAGRTFTMIFLGFGLVGLGVWWALFAAFVVETGAIVLQVRRPGDVDGKITTPRADTTLAAGDVLIALGTHEQIDELRALGGN